MRRRSTLAQQRKVVLAASPLLRRGSPPCLSAYQSCVRHAFLFCAAITVVAPTMVSQAQHLEQASSIYSRDEARLSSGGSKVNSGAAAKGSLGGEPPPPKGQSPLSPCLPIVRQTCFFVLCSNHRCGADNHFKSAIDWMQVPLTQRASTCPSLLHHVPRPRSSLTSRPRASSTSRSR